jgi:hypothetical protein
MGIGRGISGVGMGAGISAGAELDREAGGRPAVIGGGATAVREAAAGDATLPTDEPQFVQNF